MPLKLKNPIEKHFSVLSRYHYYFFTLLFASKLPVFWHILNLIFLSPPMNYYCNDDGQNSTLNTCPCDNPWWDRSVFTETTQTKFGILCDTQWLISFSQSMLYVGTLLGALTFGFLSDTFGRLSMFSMSCLILAISGCLVSIMPTAVSFIFMRTIEGLGVGGAIVTSYVLCVEYCGTRHREMVTALLHIPINLSHMCLAGVSYLLRHCDEFQIALSLPIFLCVALYWLTLESPKWLMDTGKVDEAAVVMEKISRFNRKSYESIKTELEEYQAARSKNSRTKMKFWQIFRHRKLSSNFICMAVVYFVCGMGYYGVSQYIGKMSGDIHINVAISGALLLPGTITTIFLLKILNRRTFLIATNFLSGLFMLIEVLICCDATWPRVVIVCICNCFFFMTFIIVFLYSVELFPTSVRNSVLGILSVVSRLGQISAPIINALPETSAGTIFAVMAMLGAVMCYPLPETKNTELPSSIEDSKMLPRKVRPGDEVMRMSQDG
ncbi:organic cation transporter protein isoform X1 [Manduca sexta]|uniref:organic cation transporter protein isoform X1 n=1 Tax=Manduca sexta TaxID=7130 RepID=UPI0018908048|nr:organic cation transporter protein isoform X1 [Manduca sexta]